MTILLGGMVLFFGAHLFSLSPLRDGVASKLGANRFKGLYSVVSLLGLGLIIWGFGLARSGPDAARIVYDPIEGGSRITMVLVLVALILLAAANMKGHIRKIVKHPMSVGVALWAIGHLAVNGNLSEVLMFGSFLVLSLLDIIVSTARGKLPAYEPQVKHDVIAVIAGLIVYGAVIAFHQSLFGVSPIY